MFEHFNVAKVSSHYIFNVNFFIFVKIVKLFYVLLIHLACNKSFYVMELLAKHLSETEIHQDTFKCQFCDLPISRTAAAKHMLCHGIGIFECVYCSYGTNDVAKIRSHMCNSHPTKLLYVCVRLLRKDKDAVSLFKMINYYLVLHR